MSEHSGLTLERWSRFTRTQQILQVAVELHRTRGFLGEGDGDSRRLGYERVLRLTDLTVRSQKHLGFRRELLRWRDVIAELYLRDTPDPETHELALKLVLQLDPVASEQVRYLCA